MIGTAKLQTRPKVIGERFFNSWRIGLAGVFLLAVLVYAPCLSGRPIWEDPLLISGDGTGGNSLVGAFTHPFLGSYYRPLTSVSFLIDRQLAGQGTYAYHLTSVLLHAATAVLVCCLTVLVTRRQLAGMLAGVSFALQPAQVGAVAWIGGRTDVLASFFVVGFMTTLVLYHRSRNTGWLMASAVALLAAALSKEQAIAILPVVPLSALAFGSRKWREAGLLCVPYAIAGAVYLALTFLPGKPIQPGVGDFTSLAVPILTAANYGVLFLLPTRFSQFTFTLAPLSGVAWSVFGVAAMAALLGLAPYLWKRNHAIGWIFISGLLLYLPVANLVPVSWFLVAPYRMAETGACFACVFGAAATYAWSARKQVLVLALGANLAAGAISSLAAIPSWKSSHDVNEAVLETDPHFILSQLNRLDECDYLKQYDEGISAGNNLLAWLFGVPDWSSALPPAKLKSLIPFVEARLRTNFGKPDLPYLARVFSKQAKLLHESGRGSEADALLQDGLYFAPRDSTLNYTYGLELLATDRSRALGCWEVAADTDPMSPIYSAALGHELVKDGRYSEAVGYLDRAVKLTPTVGYSWLDLADAKLGVKDFSGALVALDVASKLVPGEAVESRREKIHSLMER